MLGKNPHDVQAFVKKHVTAEQRRRPLSEARPARSRRVRLPGGGCRPTGLAAEGWGACGNFLGGLTYRLTLRLNT